MDRSGSRVLCNSCFYYILAACKGSGKAQKLRVSKSPSGNKRCGAIWTCEDMGEDWCWIYLCCNTYYGACHYYRALFFPFCAFSSWIFHSFVHSELSFNRSCEGKRGGQAFLYKMLIISFRLFPPHSEVLC